MKLHTTDLLIICAYLIAMIVIGLILKKRAAQNMDSYFLGGKSLPFYMLGGNKLGFGTGYIKRQ